MLEPALKSPPRVEGWKWGKYSLWDVDTWAWHIRIPDPDADPEDAEDDDLEIYDLYVSAPNPASEVEGPHQTMWTAQGESESGGNMMLDAVGWIAGPTPESVLDVLDAWILDGDTKFYANAREHHLTPGTEDNQSRKRTIDVIFDADAMRGFFEACAAAGAWGAALSFPDGKASLTIKPTEWGLPSEGATTSITALRLEKSGEWEPGRELTVPVWLQHGEYISIGRDDADELLDGEGPERVVKIIP